MRKGTIRYEITPENANKFGLIWWQDAIYDPAAPIELNKNVDKLVDEGKIVLGSPANTETIKNNFVGLYKKLE